MSVESTDTSNDDPRAGDLKHLPNDWWVLFPLKGIAIQDADPDVDSPMWQDTTLFSVQHLPNLVKRLRLNDRVKPGHDHERDILFMLGGRPVSDSGLRLRDHEESPDSFMAIRRRVDGFKPGEGSRIPKSAFDRAATIEAALAVGLLEEGRFGFRTCSLIRHGKQPMAPTAALDLRGGGFVMQLSGPHSLWSPKGEVMNHSRSGLQIALSSCKWRNLVSVLLSQPRRDDSAMLDKLRRSACRLAGACFALTAESQVLGMVTALEMLLSPDGDFRVLERRILALLSGVPVAPEVIRWLMEARHLHVHQGRDVAPSVPYDAMNRVLEAFERVARCREILRSQEELCLYLDARIATARLADRVAGVTSNSCASQLPLWEVVATDTARPTSDTLTHSRAAPVPDPAPKAAP